MAIRLSHLFIVASLLAFGAERRACAQSWSLEGGAVAASYFPTAPDESTAYGALGVSGTISFEIERWSFGVRTQGTISTHSKFHVIAGDYDFRGNLARREFGISALTRYFLDSSTKRRRWYLEFLFTARETDFIHAESVYTSPESPGYTRLFLRGGGFSMGAGYRPIKGPYFFQVNYELDHYENLYVVGEVNHLHQITAEPALNYNYFIHTIYVTVGLDVFGR